MKTRFGVHRLVAGLFCLVLGGGAFAQPYPDFINVPVTFYDFRSDRSNPEFEQPHDGQRLNRFIADTTIPGVNLNDQGQPRPFSMRVATGMVGQLLDIDGKPVMGSQPYMNHGIRFWFRDWNNLNQYSMRTDSSMVDGVRRGYLEKFRPFYMYRRVGDDGAGDTDLNVFGNTENGEYTAYPPMPRAQLVGNNNDNRGGHESRLGRFRPNRDEGWRYEFSVPVRSNTTTVPYIYAARAGTNGIPPSLRANGDDIHTRDGNTAGFTLQGTAGTNSFARLNFGSRTDNYDYTIDSAFSNVRIDTTIQFRHIASQPGTYELDDGTFFPLRNKGFTNSSYNWVSTNADINRNYSYSMELSRLFTMTQGLVFNFRGDDDVWVFINGRLALDLGGIHMPSSGRIRVDSLQQAWAGTPQALTNGITYELKMFYVERHTDGSSILIQTNMLTTVMQNFEIDLSSSTLKAGETVTGAAIVDAQCDPNNPNCLASGNYYWWVTDVTTGIHADERNIINGPEGRRLTLTDKAGNSIPLCAPNTPLSQCTPTKIDSVLVGAQKAYTYIQIRGVFELDGMSKDTTVTIFVRPGDPHAVFIEPSSDSTRTLSALTLQNLPQGMVLTTTNRPGGSSALRWPDPMDTIRVAGNVQSYDQFYGIVRDRFGNFIQPAAAFSSVGNPPYNGTALWSLAQIPGQVAPNGTNFGTIAGVTGQLRGQGRVTKAQEPTLRVARANLVYTINSGSFTGGPYTTSAPVVIEPFFALAVRIGMLVGGEFRPLATSPSTPQADRVTNPQPITMSVGWDTTLYVQVLRSDKLPTDPDRWILADAIWGSGGSIFQSPPSGTSPWTSFTVNAAGTGTVRATVQGSATEFAQVTINVGLGDPVSMRLYGRHVNHPAVTTTLSRTAAPDPNFIYVLPPQTVTVVAGQTLPIVPKLFADNTTNNNMWVSNVNVNSFSWSFGTDLPANNDSTRIYALGNTTGGTAISARDSIWFRSTVAHQTYSVIGTYNVGTVTVSSVLHIRVEPDFSSRRLVIEPNSNPPLQHVQKLDTLFFDSQERGSGVPKPIYAVLRDRWGNFITFAGVTYNGQPTTYPTWTKSEHDPNRVDVEPGNESLGQGMVFARDGGDARVWATSGNLRDSIVVRILSYSYTDLAVVVRVNSCNPFSDTWCRVTGDPGSPTAYYRVYTGSDTLEINSNQDTTLFTLGQVSVPVGDPNYHLNGRWEPIAADWGSTLGFDILGSEPRGVGSWPISPGGTGSGVISAITTMGGGLTGAFNIRIVVGPPTRVTLEILNPDDLRAGVPITGVIRYENRAGVITEWNPLWSKDAFFGDTLGRCTNDPATRPEPLIGSNTLGYLGIDPAHSFSSILPAASNAPLTLNLSNDRAWDEVTFTIYLAAQHQIRIYHPYPLFGFGTTPGYVTALSNHFTVRAGALASVRIEEREGDVTGRTIIPGQNGDPDTIVYSYKDGAQDIFTSVGYDEWGNRIGRQESDWSTSGSIPDPSSQLKGVDQVLYDSRRAEDSGEGWVIVVAVDENGAPILGPDGNPITARIYVRIKDIIISLTMGRTLDVNGNGYIDNIELVFDKPVKLMASGNALSQMLSAMKVTRNSDNFTVKEVIQVGGADGASAVWRLVLEENRTTRDLQTGWLLDFVIPLGLFTEVEQTSLRTVDGAAPVIFEAKKFFAQRDGDQDRMEITFSEAVTAAQFSDKTPNDVFYMWNECGENDGCTPMAKRQRLAKAASAGESCDNKVIIDSMLGGIPGLNPRVSPIVNRPNAVEFFLGSGIDKLDLNTRHFINIRTYVSGTDTTSHVKDNFDNVQKVYCNRLVQITYGNEPPMVARAIPNPSSPDPNRVQPGRLNPFHDPDAAEYVKKGGGGSIVRVPVRVPGPNEKPGVRCQIKVYDLVGNLVHAAKTNDLINDSKINTGDVGGQFMDVDLYWNGYNSKKMKVAPGTYRLIVQFDYEDSKIKSDLKGKNKFTAPVGISK